MNNIEYLKANRSQVIALLTKAFKYEDVTLKDAMTRPYRDWETDRKSTRLNSTHSAKSRMPSSA